MKNIFIKSALMVLNFIVFSAFSGCKRESAETMKNQHFTNVDYLVILNPTNQVKNINDQWISVSASTSGNRAFEDSEKEEIEVADNPFSFADYTIPFVTGTNNLILKSASVRNENAEEPVSYRKYIKGYRKTFTDAFGFGSRLRNCVMSYEGNHCYVWTDEDGDEDSTLSEEQIKIFADKFDVIYEKETALCGPKYDGSSLFENIIAPCQKVSLVLFDIGYDKGAGNVYGYFTRSDYDKNYSNGNKIEAIYVDSFYAKQEDRTPELHSTVAHEFNHMLNYVNKVLKYNLPLDSWFTEMLSMITEDFFMDELQVPESKSVWGRYGSFFLNKSFNYGFGNWRDIQNETAVTSFNYANAYSFGAFLARNYGGAQLIHDIATNEYVSEQAVTKAVNKLNGTNYSFEDLLTQWSLILINLENQNKNRPSLAKGTEGKIEGCDFVYKLKPVIPSHLFKIFDLPAETKFVSNNVSLAKDFPFDSYGFQLYQFDAPTSVDVSCMNFLQVKAYKK